MDFILFSCGRWFALDDPVANPRKPVKGDREPFAQGEARSDQG